MRLLILLSLLVLGAVLADCGNSPATRRPQTGNRGGFTRGNRAPRAVEENQAVNEEVVTKEPVQNEAEIIDKNDDIVPSEDIKKVVTHENVQHEVETADESSNRVARDIEDIQELIKKGLVGKGELGEVDEYDPKKKEVQNESDESKNGVVGKGELGEVDEYDPKKKEVKNESDESKNGLVGKGELGEVDEYDQKKEEVKNEVNDRVARSAEHGEENEELELVNALYREDEDDQVDTKDRESRKKRHAEKLSETAQMMDTYIHQILEKFTSKEDQKDWIDVILANSPESVKAELKTAHKSDHLSAFFEGVKST